MVPVFARLHAGGGTSAQTPINSVRQVGSVICGSVSSFPPVAAFHLILSGRFGRHVRAHMPAVCKSVWHACLHTLTCGVSAFVPLLKPTGVEGNERFPPVASAPASTPPACRCFLTVRTQTAWHLSPAGSHIHAGIARAHTRTRGPSRCLQRA